MRCKEDDVFKAFLHGHSVYHVSSSVISDEPCLDHGNLNDVANQEESRMCSEICMVWDNIGL